MNTSQSTGLAKKRILQGTVQKEKDSSRKRWE